MICICVLQRIRTKIVIGCLDNQCLLYAFVLIASRNQMYIMYDIYCIYANIMCIYSLYMYIYIMLIAGSEVLPSPWATNSQRLLPIYIVCTSMRQN